MNYSFEQLQYQAGTILVTGVAGFIGFHTAHKLMGFGIKVLGIDSLSDYYDVSLKKSRVSELNKQFGSQFHFVKAQIEDRQKMKEIWENASPKVTHIVHLAAQAGVRHSLIDPYSYVGANVMGNLVLLELARHHPEIKNFVYASTSSVYGSNKKLPFSEKDPTDSPIALYAATKKCDELMSQAYASLFQIPLIGLRFFTVYGPWGRPDMALFLFTKKILEGTPISVFNRGDMKRDFTYVSDIVEGILSALMTPIKPNRGEPPHRIYNLGNGHMKDLTDYIQLIEKYTGKKAQIEYTDSMQPGDIKNTYSDISQAKKELGFNPKVNIEEGVKHFVEWYLTYYKINSSKIDNLQTKATVL